jgi:glutathione S-transferase
MSELRIFSHLPNPRIWKATITARLCGVELELRGTSSKDIAQWLWDFDARPLTEAPELVSASERIGRIAFEGRRLYKTDAFLRAHPFGTVPAAFSPDGSVGIFESNSIMRAVARLGSGRRQLYGRDAYEASRIDSFLDVSLVFGREVQIYLLGLRDADNISALHAKMSEAFVVYGSGLEQALNPPRKFLVGDDLSLADICFVAEIGVFARERSQASKLAATGLRPILDDATHRFPRVMEHFARLVEHPAFAPDARPYLQHLGLI